MHRHRPRYHCGRWPVNLWQSHTSICPTLLPRLLGANLDPDPSQPRHRAEPTQLAPLLHGLPEAGIGLGFGDGLRGSPVVQDTVEIPAIGIVGVLMGPVGAVMFQAAPMVDLTDEAAAVAAHPRGLSLDEVVIGHGISPIYLYGA